MELYRALIERAPVILSLFDGDGIVKYVNAALERITGRTPSALIGRHFEELLHPEDREVARDAFEGLLDGHEIDVVQTRFLKEDGSWVTLQTVGRNCLDNSALNGILSSSRGVTVHGDRGGEKAAPETPAVQGRNVLAMLSPRELQVLEHVARGRSSKTIAAQLGISPASVDTYRSRLKHKLFVENLADLVRFAVRYGLIDP